MAAFAPGDTAHAHPWREGVHWAKEEPADLFAFTLDRTSGHFSPTTRYRDYAIPRDLIHWESQSTRPTHQAKRNNDPERLNPQRAPP